MHLLSPRPLIYFLVALLALPACGRADAGSDTTTPPDQVPEAERYGGTAVVALTADLETMNILTTSTATAQAIERDVLFMPLVRYDEELETTPGLAERWDTTRVAPDTLELTFHLRRDVRWHDGEPTTAEDVLFTFERMIDPRTAATHSYAFDLYSRTAVLVDPYTIRFRLRAHPEFLESWSWIPALPQHILGDVPPERLATHPFGSTEPVGNGPFRFVRRVPGQEWVFEANPDFPETLGGRPYLDRLVFRVIPDQTTLLTELLTGGVDVWVGVKPGEADRLRQAPEIRVVDFPTPTWAFIAWTGCSIRWQ